MSTGPQLRTRRLLLRRWRIADRGPFAAMNSDPGVMEHFPAPLSAAESDALIERIEAEFDARGHGLWAIELADEGELAGFAGLSLVDMDVPFAPAIEVGWRLARRHWGGGIATEAAGAALVFGFDELAVSEIVSFTAVANGRSRAVMERLGMRHDPAADFAHPELESDHALSAHVLYRIDRPGWRRAGGSGR